MNESRIMNEIHIAIGGGDARIFRCNVGRAWTGDAEPLPGNQMLIHNARPFRSGVPEGFSDLFGFKSIVITPDMVGKTIAVFTAIEVKSANGRVTQAQNAFIDLVKRFGGIAGIARSVEEARKIIGKL